MRTYVPSIRRFSDENKQRLSLFSSANLICIVWLALSSSSSVILAQSVGEVFLVLLAAFLMHIGFIAVNALFVFWIVRWPLREAIAIVIMTSQKSSPVALAVISYVTNNPTQKGLLAIPCIIGQLTQIFVGSLLAKYFAKVCDSKEENQISPDDEQVVVENIEYDGNIDRENIDSYDDNDVEIISHQSI